MKASVTPRSPLKEPPLRYPGQSLDEEIRRLIDDKLFGSVLPAVMMTAIAALEWLYWWQASRPNPILYTLVAFLWIAYGARRFLTLRRQVRRLKLARDGERVVGQYLEHLRARGYQVFHDLIGEHFNVDHVLIGPGGVFTVETKTHGKPLKGPAEITYDGERVTVAGRAPERDPVIQAKAQAHWLQSVLLESTGKRFEVHAVVLYPGWFVKATDRRSHDAVWVLNPKALPGFLDHQPARLADSDRHLAASHLSRWIRTLDP
ncbi:MAG TPA: nuclease-related domain-containing protein [Candidatus Competibacter sp.]|nr:nuclease-related domain-containing protein [Candidatus Competibacter sp.]